MHHTQSIAAARRTEFDHLSLSVVAGSLPSDLSGHVFVVAPVGNVGTQGFPGPHHDSAINGDGMVYRLDFAGTGASMRTRLVRSADFYTDAAAERTLLYAPFRYLNAGILRLNPLLGTRDYGNTAFVGFRLGAAHDRLAVTFDGGRPLEIDPVSLNVITPIGAVCEWRAEALPDTPFPPILTTAHPVADELTGEMFIVNYGHSVSSIAVRSLELATLLAAPQLAADLLAPMASALGVQSELRSLARKLGRAVGEAARSVARLVPFLARQIPADFLYLARWDGSGEVERTRVVEADGTPVRVRQTMHQIAVTKRFVVLMDTSMKITADQAYNAPFGRWGLLDRAVRDASTMPQHPNTRLYFVSRSDLASPAVVDGELAVIATRLEIPLEAVHFQADYEDAGDLVTLHVQHDCTLDVAEWVRSFDLGEYDRQHSPEALWGIPNVSPVEINRLARYVVHAPTASVKESRVITDDRCMWGFSLYAGPGLNMPGALPARLTSMFHVSPGFQPELITQQIYELYRDYPHRMTSLAELERMAKSGGRPSCIFRVDLTGYSIDHTRDIYELPPQSVAGTLQLVPRTSGVGTGYLVTFVITEGSREIWIFDADHVAAGPVCRLKNDQLLFGATLHSFWLPTIAPRTASYYVSPRTDYGARLHGHPLMRELFEREVYPHFP